MRYFHLRVGAVAFLLTFAALFIIWLLSPQRFANVGVAGRNEAEIFQTTLAFCIMAGLFVGIGACCYSGLLAVLIPNVFKQPHAPHYIRNVTLFCFIITTMLGIGLYPFNTQGRLSSAALGIALVAGIFFAITGNRYAHHELAQHRKQKNEG